MDLFRWYVDVPVHIRLLGAMIPWGIRLAKPNAAKVQSLEAGV